MTEIRPSHEPSRPVRISILIYFLLLLGPLFAAALSRPFALWDDLTIPEKLQAGFAHRFADLPAAVRYYFFAETYVFRPVILSFYNLFYLVFGGEFWILQGFKWCGRGLYLLLTDRLLLTFGYGGWTRLLVVTFLLFHPALQDVMLFSDDGWLALAISALLLYMVAHPPFLDLRAMPPVRYAGFLVLFLAAMGMKEVSVAFGAVLALAVTLRTGGGGRWRVLPVWILVMYWVWHLAQMVRIGLRVNTPQPSPGARFQVLLDHVSFIPVPSPFHLTALALAAALLFGVVLVTRRGTRDQQWLMGVALAGSAAMVLFTSNVQAAAIRYVIPAVVLLAMPLAAGADRLPRAVKALFVALFPMLMGVHAYSQSLAFQQFMYETSEVVTLLERKSQEGYQLAMAPDVAPEFQGAIAGYFKTYKARFYDGAGSTGVTLGSQPLPPGPTAMLSMKPPAALRDAPGYASRAAMVECFARQRYGVLQKMQAAFVSLYLRLGFSRILYDHGGPVVSFDCAFFVHSLRPALSGSGEPGTSYALGDLPVLADAMYWGALRVESGKVIFSITDTGNRVLWTAEVGATKDWQPVPLPPPGAAGGENLMLSISGSGRYAIRDFSAAPVYRRPPARRYGAIAR